MMVERLGAWGISDSIQEMGRMLLFVLSSFAWLARPPFRFVQIVKQLHFIGYKSTFVVVLTAGFTGMVLALQGYYTLRKIRIGRVARLGGRLEHDPGIGTGAGGIDGDGAGRFGHDGGNRHHAHHRADRCAGHDGDQSAAIPDRSRSWWPV